ncbi:hypothetical protein PISL3812_00586 [Talaromyces islandicus]|uniref:DNA repair protein XRCC4 n=1 Tax=Talaromyces islandicus TaxID=28573 RepID=A0A0U1LJU7_TALIS|nr:hypothetical protein PISL3812_00586 [Talaromyces islandicus]
MTTDRDGVVRIPRSDDPNSFVLVYIAPSQPASTLKLIATEGENPYVSSIKLSHLKELRSKNYQGSDEEFQNILASVLKYRPDETNIDYAQLGDIEANASLRQTKDGKNQLAIAIRKRIDTITQRVASIQLTQDDDQTIELFEWAGLMATRADSLAQQISALTERLRAAEESIKTLNSSISELVTSKKEHEDLLMANFVHVLNEKKLKIRNQQRLLAAANVDEDKIEQVSELKQASQHRLAEPKSRKGKRKPTEEPSDSDEFERMDIDQGGPTVDDEAKTDDEDLDGRETPQPLEEETESEAEEARSEEESSAPKENKSTRPKLAQPADPPPRRDLPFSKRAAPGTKIVEPSKADDEEEEGGETDDDEL